MKTSCKRVFVHAPEWITAENREIKAMVDGKPRSLNWQGRYLDLGPAASGQTVTVKFPISERTVQETIGTIKYRLLMKGNTVVRIDPSGKKCPLYQRDHYRENQVRWRSVKRFVADEVAEY